jgi:hypothetical protein
VVDSPELRAALFKFVIVLTLHAVEMGREERG